MKTEHKMFKSSFAIWAPVLSACLVACSNGKLYPVYDEPSSDANAVGPSNTDTETDTEKPPHDDSDSDHLPPRDSDTFPVTSDSDVSTDSEAVECPSNAECHDWIFCDTYDWPVIAGTCPNSLFCCEKPPPPECPFDFCFPSDSLACMDGLITRETCSPGAMCCRKVEPPDSMPPCEIMAIPENACVFDAQACINAGGSPHGALCYKDGQQTNEVCCFYSQ